MTYLDHDHSERENVCFLAVFPTNQDLRRSPLRAVATLARSTLDGIRVLSKRSKAKICDARTTSFVHKDVWLTGCQDGGKPRLRTTTYSLKVSVNYVAGI